MKIIKDETIETLCDVVDEMTALTYLHYLVEAAEVENNCKMELLGYRGMELAPEYITKLEEMAVFQLRDIVYSDDFTSLINP